MHNRMNEPPTLMTEIHETVKQRMDQNQESFEEYQDLVDQVIDEYLEFGRMTVDEDSKSLREGLERMFWEGRDKASEDEESLATDV